MIKFSCPECGKKYQVEEAHAGRTTQCRSCGAALTVPAADDAWLGEQGLAESADPMQQQPDAPESVEASPASAPPPLLPPTGRPQGAPPPYAAAPPIEPGDIGAGGTVSTSGLAVAALVLGILGIACFPLGLVAVVLGIIALNQISNPANRQSGRGIAMTGTILGGVTAILSIGLMLLGILLPALGSARVTANKARNLTQTRGIVQNMTVYAAMNNDQLPGLDQTPEQPLTSDRLALLFGNGLSAELAINPLDSKTLWTGGAVTTDNFSYAMLKIEDPQQDAGRRATWVNNTDTLAPFISDRNTAAPGAVAGSLWDPSAWEGAVGWGDGHGSYEDWPQVRRRSMATTCRTITSLKITRAVTMR